MKLLIVEDDPTLARVLAQGAGEAGYAPTVVGDGREALGLLQREAFDIVLLDRMLPGLDGLQVCLQARAFGFSAPILFATARDTTRDKVEGLDAGADDYIVKPFPVAELLARMRALLRRAGASASAPTPALRVGDLTLDPETRLAHRGGRTIRLSATEYALLHVLMSHAGRVLPRATLLDRVWGYDFGGADNVLDVYIGYLRGKIDRGFETRLIRTARGVGFQIESRAGGEKG